MYGGCSAVLTGFDDACGFEVGRGHSLLLHSGEESGGVLRGESETEIADGFRSEAATGEISHGRLSGRFIEGSVVVCGGGHIGGGDTLGGFTFAGVERFAPRHFQPGPLSELLQRLHETHAGDGGKEGENIASLAAAEAMERTAVRD